MLCLFCHNKKWKLKKCRLWIHAIFLVPWVRGRVGSNGYNFCDFPEGSSPLSRTGLSFEGRAEGIINKSCENKKWPACWGLPNPLLFLPCQRGRHSFHASLNGTRFHVNSTGCCLCNICNVWGNVPEVVHTVSQESWSCAEVVLSLFYTVVCSIKAVWSRTDCVCNGGPISSQWSWVSCKKWKDWLVWLSWLGVVLQTERSWVWLPIRAHAWVVGSLLSWGVCKRQAIDISLLHQCFSPCLSPHLPLTLESIQENTRRNGSICDWGGIFFSDGSTICGFWQ